MAYIHYIFGNILKYILMSNAIVAKMCKRN